MPGFKEAFDAATQVVVADAGIVEHATARLDAAAGTAAKNMNSLSAATEKYYETLANNYGVHVAATGTSDPGSPFVQLPLVQQDHIPDANIGSDGKPIFGSMYADLTQYMSYPPAPALPPDDSGEDGGGAP